MTHGAFSYDMSLLPTIKAGPEERRLLRSATDSRAWSSCMGSSSNCHGRAVGREDNERGGGTISEMRNQMPVPSVTPSGNYQSLRRGRSLRLGRRGALLKQARHTPATPDHSTPIPPQAYRTQQNTPPQIDFPVSARTVCQTRIPRGLVDRRYAQTS